ncbi:oligosaccharide flippase family protein [Fictibacillus nanhaiensis]|uniref:Oligosaccharide flippase family protein n=1 Tax=Fictibacillus nanhaiensis TaxID=742169 RepID=A0ABS2ZNQ7_9BACL|nr:oligosaccharide flippase family protein [Fictibacillus nanhaiensis]
MNSLKGDIIKLIKTGFFHIFTSQVINKILLFSTVLILVRIVSKTDYGIYSYSNNIVSMFLLLNGLGAVSGLLQFGSENRKNPDKLLAYSQFARKVGIMASLFISLLISLYAIFIDTNIEGVTTLLLLMSFLPLTQYLYSYIEIGFRIRLQNKLFSMLSILNSVLVLIFTLIGATLFGITGVVVCQYIGFFLSILFAMFIANRKGHLKNTTLKLTYKEKKQFVKLSFISSLSNAISQMLYLIDVLIIGIIIQSTLVIASYKTATVIPFAILFIPMAIITYIYPYFASHNNDREWIRSNYLKLIKGLILLNGIISIGMYIGAPWIIGFLFGDEYMSAVEPFRVLAIGYFIAATFRIPSGNVLVTLRRVSFNFYNALISGIFNVILNVLLISKFGSIGAAYSTVGVYIISSLISTIYLYKILYKDKKILPEI